MRVFMFLRVTWDARGSVNHADCELAPPFCARDFFLRVTLQIFFEISATESVNYVRGRIREATSEGSNLRGSRSVNLNAGVMRSHIVYLLFLNKYSSYTHKKVGHITLYY